MPYQWDSRLGQLVWMDGASGPNALIPRTSGSSGAGGAAAGGAAGGSYPVPPPSRAQELPWIDPFFAPLGGAIGSFSDPSNPFSQAPPPANPLPVGRPAPKVGAAAGAAAPAYDPIAEQRGILDDWNYTTQHELQSWYNNERDLNNQDWNNQLAWEQATGANVADIGGRRDYYNASDRAALDEYTRTNTAAANRAVEANYGALGTFQGRNAELFNSQVPMLTASTWQSNPQDLANQNRALSQFGDIYGGSLDYQSQGAQAYADPATIAGQWNVYGQLQGAAGGSLDTISQAAQAYASAGTVQEQKAALAQLKSLAQREGVSWEQLEEVIGEYKALSNPEITDQERFILTEFSQRREDMERAAREARMSDLAARGLRSGAAESTAMQGAQQELGRQSVLTELGASANAIARADRNRQMWGEGSKFALGAEQQAAGMYYDAAGQLRSQEFDEAYSRGLAADQTAIANSNRRLQAMGMSAQQINEMRNASFNEAYSRGIAADNASANNQYTRLSGAQGFADQSNRIRMDNDVVGTFNASQTNLVGMNNQQVKLQDLTRRQGVASGDLYGTLDATNSSVGISRNAADANFGATRQVNDTGWGRDGQVFGANQGLIDGTIAGRGTVNATARDTGRTRLTAFTGQAGQLAAGRSAIAGNKNLYSTW